jgi:hypothetical protein
VPFLIAPLLLACGSTRPPEPQGPDGKALAMETLVQARSTEVVLSVRWRAKAKVQAIRVEEEAPGIQLARGSAIVTIEGLRIEADEVKLRWLAEADENLLLYAKDVKLFRQRRGQPYETKDIAMLTMANDQVSFFQ